LGERLLCKQEVIGSIPFTSTRKAASCRLAACKPGRRAGMDREKTQVRPGGSGLAGDRASCPSIV
jgi:hypothetical protein